MKGTSTLASQMGLEKLVTAGAIADAVTFGVTPAIVLTFEFDLTGSDGDIEF